MGITRRWRCATVRIGLGKRQYSSSSAVRDSRDGHRFHSLHRPPRDGVRRNHPAVLPDLALDRQQERERFRSGHRGRPRRRSGDAPPDQGQLSPARHRRRGVRQRARGRRICLGARSDRRHQILHRGISDLGHADRAVAQGHAGVRHDAPALYRRALFRRFRLGAVFRAVRRAAAHGAALRDAEGSDLFHHQPAADERRRPRSSSAGSRGRCS